MNPGEKAKQIIDKFLPLVEAFTEVGRLENAKKCALIAVDEILNARETVNVHINQHCESNLFDFMHYWQEVKQEIELL